MTTDGRVLHHRLECPDRSAIELTTIGGRAVQLCRACKRYSRVDRLAAETKPPAPSVAKKRPLVSRYVCRAHPETPVTWRGDGCDQCRTTRRARRPAGGAVR